MSFSVKYEKMLKDRYIYVKSSTAYSVKFFHILSSVCVFVSFVFNLFRLKITKNALTFSESDASQLYICLVLRILTEQ